MLGFSNFCRLDRVQAPVSSVLASLGRVGLPKRLQWDEATRTNFGRQGVLTLLCRKDGTAKSAAVFAFVQALVRLSVITEAAAI